jgi:HSP20 family protein
MTYYISTYPTRMARRMMARPEAGQSAGYALPVNILEEQDAYILSALVPGLKADDLNIQILEDVVTLEGTYTADESEYLLRELPHGEFQRSLRLPIQLDADKAEAKIKDGLLTLRIPKAESARPKSIKIAVK